MVGKIGAPDCGTTYALRVRLGMALGSVPVGAGSGGSVRTGVDVDELQPELQPPEGT
jgi:hypothetical protein